MGWWRKREEQPGGDGRGGRPQPAGHPPGARHQDLQGRRRRDAALDDITLDIQRGEYVSVSGPSGCGKSTFLSISPLLDTPTIGRYWLNGRATDRLSPGEKARVRNLDVGLIFQSFNLIGDMTIYENVEYPLTLRGVAPADRKARVEAALERVGLAPRAKAASRVVCPAGNQQLVAVARAITGRPPSCWPTSRRATWIRRAARR
jgi:ABC-type lipoprotein export system ATPase subunit